MIKINSSIFYFLHCVFRIMDIRFLAEHLADTADAGKGHTDHDHDHGQHHKAHEQRHDIAEQTGQIAGRQGSAHDKLRAKPGHGNNTEIHSDHHGRIVKCKQSLCLYGQIIQHFGCLGKLLIFMVFPDKCFDHTDGRDIFLHAGIQIILGHVRLHLLLLVCSVPACTNVIL